MAFLMSIRVIDVPILLAAFVLITFLSKVVLKKNSSLKLNWWIALAITLSHVYVREFILK